MNEFPIDVTRRPYYADPRGIEDSSDAIIAAVGARGASEKVVIDLPRGVFLVSKEIQLTRHRTTLRGAGPGITIIKFAPTDHDMVCVLASATASNRWAPNYSYAQGAFVRPKTTTISGNLVNPAFVYEKTNTGQQTSGGVEPAWPLVKGGTVSDNGITWTCREPGALEHIAIEDLMIDTDDVTYRKTAIQLAHCRQSHVHNVAIRGQYAAPGSGSRYWSGGASNTQGRGLQINGHESISVTHFSSYADLPVRIGLNPNDPSITCDHFRGQDWELHANGNYNIEIDPQSIISSMTLDGRQAWVGGIGGLRFDDTVGVVGTWSMIKIQNARLEQCRDPNGWLLYLNSTRSIYNLEVTNVRGSIGENPGPGPGGITTPPYGNGALMDHNSIYLRNVISATIGGLFESANTGAGRTFIDSIAYNDTYNIAFDHLLLASDRVVSLTDYKLVHGAYSMWPNQPIPGRSVYAYNGAGDKNWSWLGDGRKTMRAYENVAVGATVDLGTFVAGLRMAMIFAIAAGATLRERLHLTIIDDVAFREADSSTNTDDADTAGNLCIYVDAGDGNKVKMKNNTAEELDVRIAFFGW